MGVFRYVVAPSVRAHAGIALWCGTLTICQGRHQAHTPGFSVPASQSLVQDLQRDCHSADIIAP